MKKITALLLTSTLIALCFAGCASNDSATTKETINTSTETTETTTTEPAVKELREYLPSSLETMKQLKAYFEEHGYSFDSWQVEKDTETEYQAVKPGNGGGIIASEGYLMFNLGNTSSTNAVILNNKSAAEFNLDIQISSDSSLDAFEIFDLIFSECPEEVAPPTEEINQKINENKNTYVDIEKDGLYYRSSLWDTKNGNTFIMTGVSAEKPYGWNG